MNLRLLLTLIVLTALAWAQTPAAPGSPTLAPSLLAPSVGVIDFFGLNKIPVDRLRKILGFQEGDPFPRSKAETEEHIDTLAGVVESHLEAVCCDAGRTVMYVGIEERGAPHFDLHEEPEGEQTLPEPVTRTYRDYQAAFEAAVTRGSTAEDLTRGYSLMADPVAREIQQKFTVLAKEQMAELRDVLRNSADEEQRAMATYIIGYAPSQADAAADLQYALRDADPGVRANAVHGLMALGVYARLHPDAGLKLETTWLIEMLHSLSWSDRDRALKALEIFTDQRDPAILAQLKDRALPALVEMARWKTLAHALPAVILTGRIAGWTEQQIDEAWARGDRESVIAAAAGNSSRRSR